nr:hypothetical protein [Tanacetum cinerariifolium]
MSPDASIDDSPGAISETAFDAGDATARYCLVYSSNNRRKGMEAESSISSQYQNPLANVEKRTPTTTIENESKSETDPAARDIKTSYGKSLSRVRSALLD